MSSIASKVGRGSIWIAASRLMMNLIGLISTIALAKLLLPPDFRFGLLLTALTMGTLACIVYLTCLFGLWELSNEPKGRAGIYADHVYGALLSELYASGKEDPTMKIAVSGRATFWQCRTSGTPGLLLLYCNVRGLP